MGNLIKSIMKFWHTKFSNECQEYKIVEYFAREGHLQVQGWLSSYSLSVSKILADFQRDNGIVGNVAEIGVFHGRFFIALCLLMQRSENAVAIDVFSNQELNLDNSGVGDYSEFCANITKFVGYENNIKIIHRDSLLVRSNDLLGKFDNSLKVRLFSVDGCHTVEHTLSDLRLAGKVICDGGVIILDDFRNTEWPGVETGLNQFFEQFSSIVPIAFAYNKLYLTTRTYQNKYVACLLEKTNAKLRDFDSVDICGKEVPVLQPPVPEAHFKSSFIKFIDFSNAPPSGTLQQGWFDAESWGVWSDGHQQSTVFIENDFLSNCSSNVTMVVAFHAFVAGSNSSASVVISIDKVVVGSVLYSFGTDYINWEFSLPDELLKASGWTIGFDVKDAKSPQELGISEDSRVLGVGLRNVSFY